MNRRSFFAFLGLAPAVVPAALKAMPPAEVLLPGVGVGPLMPLEEYAIIDHDIDIRSAIIDRLSGCRTWKTNFEADLKDSYYFVADNGCDRAA